MLEFVVGVIIFLIVVNLLAAIGSGLMHATRAIPRSFTKQANAEREARWRYPPTEKRKP